ncbi:MAG: SDR family oxidoreductase [Oscillatoriales cyanobacterium]|nr:MAG: SDR family oxidoreductase [Oscillatoriales cyanobacterium]
MNDRTTKQALITGASSGIGKATALGFAAVGINLALVSRESENLEAVATAAREFGVKAEAYPLDLAKIEQVQMGYTGSLTETPLADWQNVLDLNLTSVWQCILGILPGMRDRRSGIIINVSSIAGTQTFPNWGAYCVSKFGLMALSKTLAAEERAGGIRVTAICPGSVNTPMWDTESVQADFDRSAMLTPEIVAQSILHAVQLPTSAVIEEITLMSNAGVL